MNAYHAEVKEGDLIHFRYKNWMGETRDRKAIVKCFFFGKTEFHNKYQVFIRAFDLDKLEQREFAVNDVIALEVVKV